MYSSLAPLIGNLTFALDSPSSHGCVCVCVCERVWVCRVCIVLLIIRAPVQISHHIFCFSPQRCSRMESHCRHTCISPARSPHSCGGRACDRGSRSRGVCRPRWNVQMLGHVRITQIEKKQRFVLVLTLFCFPVVPLSVFRAGHRRVRQRK